LLWQLVSYWHVYDNHLLPPPSYIVKAFVQMAQSGEWFVDVRDSLIRYGLGLLLGCFTGVAVGLVTGGIWPVRAALAPMLDFSRSTPMIALVPLFIVFFGIGLEEKVYLVAWGVFFPVWLNTQAGVSSTEREYLWAARSLGSSGWQLYGEVLLPRALPYIIVGVRVGITTGFFALGAAEVAGAFSGVVFRSYYSHQMFRTDKMMVAILTVGFLGFLCDRLYAITMTRLVPWWKENLDDLD
jgi:ABC-type nitrate/sulfonate/bicarbonate transport system permease component